MTRWSPRVRSLHQVRENYDLSHPLQYVSCQPLDRIHKSTHDQQLSKYHVSSSWTGLRWTSTQTWESCSPWNVCKCRTSILRCGTMSTEESLYSTEMMSVQHDNNTIFQKIVIIVFRQQSTYEKIWHPDYFGRVRKLYDLSQPLQKWTRSVSKDEGNKSVLLNVVSAITGFSYHWNSVVFSKFAFVLSSFYFHLHLFCQVYEIYIWNGHAIIKNSVALVSVTGSIGLICDVVDGGRVS